MGSCFVSRTAYGYKTLFRLFVETIKFISNGLLNWKCDQGAFILLITSTSACIIVILNIIKLQTLSTNDFLFDVSMILGLPFMVTVIMYPVYYAVYECYIDKEV